MHTIFNKLGNNIKLNKNEKTICEYINDHLEEIPRLSSRELGKRTFTSSSVVLRLSKKLGFESYNDFKLNIVSFLKDIEIEDTRIEGNEDYLLMINKFTELEIDTIRKTKEMLSVNTLKMACELLNHSIHIDIIANDANADIANYARHNFYMAGKIATVYSESDSQLYCSILSPADHVVIVMTKYGKNKRINDAVKILKKRGVPVIAFIRENNKLYINLCDCVFFCSYYDSLQKLGDLVYNISTKYLFDLIFSVLFSQNYEKTVKLENLHKNIFNQGYK